MAVVRSQAWLASMRRVMSGPTASRMLRRRASSSSKVAPSLTLIIRNPFSTTARARSPESGTRLAQSVGVPAKKASRLLAAGLVLAALGSARVDGERASDDSTRDRSLTIERLHFNKLANSSFTSGAATENLPLPQWFSIRAATNASPIEIATGIPHGLSDGDAVLIKGVSGNTASNGWWTIVVRSPTTFALDGSNGDGTYDGGGSVFPAAGQPPPPGPADGKGELLWTPWFSGH